MSQEKEPQPKPELKATNSESNEGELSGLSKEDRELLDKGQKERQIMGEVIVKILKLDPNTPPDFAVDELVDRWGREVLKKLDPEVKDFSPQKLKDTLEKAEKAASKIKKQAPIDKTKENSWISYT